MCTFHLVVNPTTTASAEWKQPTAMPPVYLFTFSVWFWFSLGSRHVWLPFLPYAFQQSTLPVSNRSTLNFLDSTEAAGRPTFIRFLASSPPAFTDGWCSLPVIHPKFQGDLAFLVFILLQAWLAPRSPPASKYVHFPDFTSHPFGFVTTVYPFSVWFTHMTISSM